MAVGVILLTRYTKRNEAKRSETRLRKGHQMKTNQVRKLLEILGDDEGGDGDGDGGEREAPAWLGEKVLIRTVTTYFTGQAKRVQGGMVYLEDAAWVVNTGRFNANLTTGVLDEVEPYPEGVWVNLDVIVDVSPWNHPLPRTVK